MKSDVKYICLTSVSKTFFVWFARFVQSFRNMLQKRILPSLLMLIRINLGIKEISR